MVNRREFLFGIASAATATGSVAHAAAPSRALSHASGAPNILIFMPDQQAGSTVLPDSPVVKPNLDRFSRESLSFTSAHCPAPHCCPSRASFLTGLYPSEHGVYNNVTTDTAIHPNPYPGTPFWARWLRDAGYETGYAGKLHVGRDFKPEDCGFRTFSSLEQDTFSQNEQNKVEEWQSARDSSSSHQRRQSEILRPDWPEFTLYSTLPDDGPEGYESLPDYKVVEAGIRGMHKLSESGHPWCLMVSNSGSHDPYDAPKRFVDLYDVDTIKLPPSFPDSLHDKPRIYQRQRYQVWSQLSDQENKQAILHYRARCSMQDDLFGRLLRALDETGQAENTIVLYVSDHGDYAGAHGLWLKGVPSFREAYHIPAIIRWPRGIRNPGRAVDAFVNQVDFGSTFLEAAGVAPRQPLSGRSLMPFFQEATPSDWRDHYCTQMNGVELYYSQRIVATRNWKYVYNGFDFDELYDLVNDPTEVHNLAFPDFDKERQRVLSGQGVDASAQTAWPPLPPELDGVRRQLLKKMWDFAATHHDIIFNSYGTAALAPYGPALGSSPGDFQRHGIHFNRQGVEK